MARCILHIGMHKTGSTSIQRSLQSFGDSRFLYADLGGVGNHSVPLHALFTSNPGKDRWHRNRDAAELAAYIGKCRANLEHNIEMLQGRTLILSAESLCLRFAKEDLARLRQFLQRHFDELAIVGYVRPPAGLMTSVFQQRVKTGWAHGLEHDSMLWSYRDVFSRFDDVFGRENVQLWKFDPRSFPGGCVVRDFCSRLGISLPAEKIVRTNESLSHQAVCARYTYSKFRQRFGVPKLNAQERRELDSLLGKLGRDRFRLSPDVTNPVLERNAADIDWMEARLGQPLHEPTGEHRPEDVRDESDLLGPDPKIVSRLLALLGERAPEGVKGETPEQVAMLVHVLRGKPVPELLQSMDPAASTGAAGAMSGDNGRIQMSAAGIVARLRQASPGSMDGLRADQAVDLVEEVFSQLRSALASADEGAADFTGLGRFLARKRGAEADRNGAARTQFMFRTR